MALLFVCFNVVALIPSSSYAWAFYCTNCSTEFTQMMERVTSLEQLAKLAGQLEEALTQTEQQIRMVEQNIERYQNMVKNTKNLGQDVLSRLSGEFKRLGDLYQSMETRRGDIDAMRRAYKDMYPSFDNMAEEQGARYQERWQQWSSEVDRATRSTMEQSGRQLKDLQDASSYDSNIQKLLNTPEGRMEAIQAGNQLTAMQLQEARELRGLMATALQEQATVNAKAEKLEQAREEQRQRLMSPRATPVNPRASSVEPGF